MSLKTKLLLAFLGVVSLTLLLSFGLSFQKTQEFFLQEQEQLHEIFRQNLRRTLMELASVAALAVDGDLVRELSSRKDESRSEYIEQRKRLIMLRERLPEIRYLYVYRPLPGAPGKVQMIIGGEPFDAPENEVTVFEPYDSSSFPNMTMGFEKAAADQEITVDAFGSWLSGYAPVLDKKGRKVGAVGLDLPADRVTAREQRLQSIIEATQTSLLQRLALSSLIALAVALLVGYLLARLIARPVLDLVGATGLIAGGDLDAEVDIQRHDEIGDLARSFNRMTSNLREMASALQQYAVTSAKERELEVAANLRQELAPEPYVSIAGIPFASELRTSTFGGSIAYDAFALGQDAYLLVAMLHTPQGKPEATAALVRCRTGLGFLTGNVVFRPQDLAKCLSQKILAQEEPEKQSLDFLCGVYDKARSWLTVVNAGGAYPYLTRPARQEILQLDQDGGPPLGKEPNAKYSDFGIQVEPGDRLVLYSPYLLTLKNEQGETYGLPRFEEALRHNLELNLESMKKALLEEALRWAGQEAQADGDLAILALEF